MKTKKSGLFAALAVVLLLTAILITNCTDPLGSGGLQAPNTKTDFQPPVGKSVVRLNVGSSNGRTIMPDTTINSFTHFTVTIANTDTTTGTDFNPAEKREFTSLSALQIAEITVTLGKSYAITVDAYTNWTDGDSGEIVAATGAIATPITITNIPANNIATIALKPKTADGTETGIFAWNLTYNAVANFSLLDTATLTITELDGTPVVAPTELYIAEDTPDPAVNNATGSDDIGSGYYYVIVTLEQDDYVPIVYTDIVHIYQEMTSTFTKNFATLVALPTYNVTFNDYNSAGNDNATPVAYTHASPLNTTGKYPSGYPTAEDTSGNGTAGGFLGWYTAAGGSAGSGDKVALSDKIYQARTLYGSWYVTPELTFSVTLDIGDDKAFGLTLASGFANIAKASLNTSTGVTITAVDLDSLSAISGTFVKWVIGGVEFNTAAPVIKYGLGVGYENLDLVLATGTVDIMLQITAIIDGETKNYSKVFNVPIV